MITLKLGYNLNRLVIHLRGKIGKKDKNKVPVEVLYEKRLLNEVL